MGRNTSIRRQFRLPLWVGWVSLVLVLALLTAGLGYAAGPLARERRWLIDQEDSGFDSEAVSRIYSNPLSNGVISQAGQPEYQMLDPEQVKTVMAATVPQLPGKYGAAVAGLGESRLSYESGGHTPLMPASTLKVLNALAILNRLGPDHTFTTSVVSASPTMIVLVGGGDPLLASTSHSYHYAAMIDLPNTADLAAKTAAALRDQGMAKVTLGYDDSLFSGPVWHKDWPADDREFIAPISALALDEGVGSPGIESGSANAAARFADQLRAEGIEVSGNPVPASAGDGARIASVNSVPLRLLIQEMLVHSDNFIAEMLLRQLDVATGGRGSFEGGTAALTQALTGLGLWDQGQHIVDGSGLSQNDRITPAALVRALEQVQRRDDLTAIWSGLPVAGGTGTLGNRFADEASTPGRGIVRAKTGTLDGVSALAGYTLTKDGALVAFAFIGNDLPHDQDVTLWFDHVSAALAGCNCAE